jgi:hypothetical protein
MFQMITAKTSKLELIRSFSSLTLTNIVKESYPSIGELARRHGNEKIEKCVCVLVADLNEAFSGELTTSNIEEIAVEATSGLLKNHSLESIYWTFKNLKTADIYGKLTVNKVLKAIMESFDQISNAVATENYNRHLATKFNQPRETAEGYRERLKNELNIAKTALEIEKTLKK